MKAREFWDAVGTEKAKLVIEKAGTEWSYWKHIAANRKRPGVDLARRLVQASRELTPGHELTLDELLTPRDSIKRNKK